MEYTFIPCKEHDHYYRSCAACCTATLDKMIHNLNTREMERAHAPEVKPRFTQGIEFTDRDNNPHLHVVEVWYDSGKRHTETIDTECCPTCKGVQHP